MTDPWAPKVEPDRLAAKAPAPDAADWLDVGTTHGDDCPLVLADFNPHRTVGDLRALLARADAERPLLTDLADTFCFMRRHRHSDDSSCTKSRDEADRVVELIRLRHSALPVPAPAGEETPQ